MSNKVRSFFSGSRCFLVKTRVAVRNWDCWVYAKVFVACKFVYNEGAPC